MSKVTNREIEYNGGWIQVDDAWSYASADDPTFTITVPSGAASKYSAGMRIRLTQTTVKYFIITKVADTVLTVYGGTDYDLANAAISEISYSTQKAPLGFPLDSTKWTVTATDTSDRSQATPAASTWYNLGSFSSSIPIGSWKLSYKVACRHAKSATTVAVWTTLSTANNSESDSDFTAWAAINVGGASSTIVYATLGIEKNVILASKTAYYLNTMTNQAAVNTDIQNYNSTIHPAIIKAICAYL